HFIEIVPASFGQCHAERSAAVTTVFVIVAANLILMQKVEHSPKKLILFRLAVSLVVANFIFLAPLNQFTAVRQFHPRLAVNAHNEILLQHAADSAAWALWLGGGPRRCRVGQFPVPFHVVSHASRPPICKESPSISPGST